MRALLQSWDGVRHRDGDSAGGQKIVIVFGVANTGCVLGRDAELFESGEKAVAFVDAGRIDEDGALVVREFTGHAGFLNGLVNGCGVRSPGFEDHMAGEERNATAAECLEERARRRIGQQRVKTRLRIVHDRAVFDDDQIEQVEIGEGAGKITQGASGVEDEFAA